MGAPSLDEGHTAHVFEFVSQISILPNSLSRCSWGVLLALSLGFTSTWAWREAMVQADGRAWISPFCPPCRISVG